jgi:serine/threonine protein phosphatase 1
MRTLAIGDIHGCSAALDALLAAVSPTPDDQIVTLGDYVDRGPDTRGVLDRLLELDRSHRLAPLRGNHEIMMMDARTHGLGLWSQVGGDQTLASYTQDGQPARLSDVPKEHWEFIEHRCLPWHETPTHIFVHAGLHPDVPLREQDEYDLFWQRLHPEFLRPHASGKTVICGHTAQHTGEPLNLGHTICIDTWVYAAGWLTCLDASSGHIWQANQAGQVREGWLDDFARNPDRESAM